ncbi:MAG: hypothetical protein EBT15_07255 [Betaproteobacteria bacterium]|nr:hypothetical protein [Betaproteobacteria bacterium]
MAKFVLMLLGLMAPPDYAPAVGVEAAYAIHAAPKDKGPKCCGICKCGKIRHADGHITDCPCPPTCKCKQCPQKK